MFTLGQTVFANYQKLGKQYLGNIVKINTDGTYNIQYKDGDHEEGVTADALSTSRFHV